MSVLFVQLINHLDQNTTKHHKDISYKPKINDYHIEIILIVSIHLFLGGMFYHINLIDQESLFENLPKTVFLHISPYVKL